MIEYKPFRLTVVPDKQKKNPRKPTTEDINIAVKKFLDGGKVITILPIEKASRSYYISTSKSNESPYIDIFNSTHF